MHVPPECSGALSFAVAGAHVTALTQIHAVMRVLAGMLKLPGPSLAH